MKLSTKRQAELRQLAHAIRADENACEKGGVELCEWVARSNNPAIPRQELTLADVEFIDNVLDDVDSLTVDAVTILDVSHADSFSVNCVNHFTNTPEGHKAARDTFAAWVREAAGNEEITDEQMEAFIDAGKYEVGEGFIAMISSS